MATKNFLNARLSLKYDTLLQWQTNNPKLNRGEVAFVEIPAPEGSVKQAPSILIKVGDGENKFNDLKWTSGLAANVSDWALAATKPEYGFGEIKETVSYQLVHGTDTETAYVYKLQSQVKGTETWTDVSTIEVPMYDDSGIKKDIEDLQALVSGNVAQQIADALAEAKAYTDTEVGKVDAKVEAITKDATITTFKGVEEALAGKETAGAAATAKTEAVAAAKEYTDAEIVKVNTALDGKEIAGSAATALENAKAYTDQEVKKVVDNQIATNIADIAQLKTDVAAAQGTADSAVEAAGVADGKAVAAQGAAEAAQGTADTALANAATADGKAVAAQGTADTALANAATADGKAVAAQNAVDALTGKVGTVADDTTVVDMIAAVDGKADTNAAGIEELQGKVRDLIEGTYDDSELRGLIKDNADAIDAIEADYLTSTDKTELQDQITTNTNAIALLTDGVDAEKVDGVKDLIDYVEKHGTEVTGMKGDIKANADAIALLNDTTGKEGSVAKTVADAITALNIDQYATDTELAAAVERIAENEKDIAALETAVATAQGAAEAADGKAVAAQGTADTALANAATAQAAAEAADGKAVAAQNALDAHKEAAVVDGDELIINCGTSAF